MNIQQLRYVVAIANSGTVFDLSLLDKITDSEGNLIQDFTPEATGHVDIADSTWDAVHQGMRAVITDGSVNKIFKDLEVEIAGKTGTAERADENGGYLKENYMSSFMGFAPAQSPKVLCYITLDGTPSGSDAAAVPFQSIMANALDVLGIPHTK